MPIYFAESNSVRDNYVLKRAVFRQTALRYSLRMDKNMANYLEIKNVSDGYVGKVRQDLKFKTGNFVWKIFFNIPLNPSTVNNQNLTVTDASGKPLNTHITYNSELHAIEIAPKQAYAQGESYFLHIGKLVESRGGQRLKDEISIEFAV